MFYSRAYSANFISYDRGRRSNRRPVRNIHGVYTRTEREREDSGWRVHRPVGV